MRGFKTLTWMNEPPVWSVEGRTLRIETGERTDFWRETFYGFARDSGHLMHHPVSGDFSAEVTVRATYEALYDQAGLMLWMSDSQWIKCGIEMTDGHPYFSTVVTNGRSDWSVMALGFDASDVRLRLTRHGDAVRVQVKGPDGWIMARLAPLGAGPGLLGPMACSPERGGFAVTFEGYICGPAIGRDLHEGN